MAQHDYNIANADFPTIRSDMNSVLTAIATNNSGPSAPGTTYANQWWFDTTNDLLMMRNEANTGWITIGHFDSSTNLFQPRVRSMRALDGNGITFKTDEGTDRVFMSDTGQVGVGGSAAATVLLDLQSTTMGFRAPVMTSAQRAAIVSPVAGLMVYNSTTNVYEIYNGSGWIALGGSSDAGQVGFFAMNAPPTGWLKANGAAVSRTTYASLFAAIGTTFGVGNGTTTFNVPDMRGEFPRGWDDGRGVDTGRAFGSAQSGQNLAHTHTGSTDSAGAHTHTTAVLTTANPSLAGTGGSGAQVVSGNTSSAGAHTHTLTIASDGGTEARPRNIALLACIKF